MKDLIKSELQAHKETIESVIAELEQPIEEACKMAVEAINTNHKILFFGNGGSAADAQHIAAEFVVRLSKELERPALPAIALSTDPSILTASSNDNGFKTVFRHRNGGNGGYP